MQQSMRFQIHLDFHLLLVDFHLLHLDFHLDFHLLLMDCRRSWCMACTPAAGRAGGGWDLHIGRWSPWWQDPARCLEGRAREDGGTLGSTSQGGKVSGCRLLHVKVRSQGRDPLPKQRMKPGNREETYLHTIRREGRGVRTHSRCRSARRGRVHRGVEPCPWRCRWSQGDTVVSEQQSRMFQERGCSVLQEQGSAASPGCSRIQEDRAGGVVPRRCTGILPAPMGLFQHMLVSDICDDV